MGRTDNGILRPHQSTISLLQRLLDLAVIGGGMSLVVIAGGQAMGKEHTILLLLALFLFHFLGDFGQLYTSWRGERVTGELIKVGGNWATSFACVFLASRLFGASACLNADAFLQWFGVVLLVLCGYRATLRHLLRSLRVRGFNTRSVAIAGAGPVGRKLAQHITGAPWMGLNLLGFYDDRQRDCVQIPHSRVRIPISGNLERLIEEARNGEIDRIYIALPMRSEARIRWLVDQLSDTTASVYLIPDVFIFELLHARSQSINGLPTISIFDTPMDGINRFVKRLADIAIGSLILMLIALPMLVIAAAVKYSSPGPVIFRQKRYGIDGQPIEVWKFRSMRVMENGTTVTQATRNDSRITPVGAFLRRTSLDELPQFINVLRGEMSIVGPRPHAVAHNEEYRGQISGYMLRHKVKPGITGWAQINGWRGETDTLDKMRKRIEHDLDYIRNWSLWWDLKIIFLTIFKGFLNKNAY